MKIVKNTCVAIFMSNVTFGATLLDIGEIKMTGVRNVPTEQEVHGFYRELERVVIEHPDGIVMVIGDKGTEKFAEFGAGTIFIDPTSGEQEVPCFGLPDRLFFKAKFSDFMHFVTTTTPYINTLENSCRCIFDDWAILCSEPGGCGEIFNRFSRSKKMKFAERLLKQPDGAIITSNFCLRPVEFTNFDFSLFLENPRANPTHAIELKSTTRDVWLLDPVKAYTEIVHMCFVHRLDHTGTKIRGEPKENLQKELKRRGMTFEDFERLECFFGAGNASSQRFAKILVNRQLWENEQEETYQLLLEELQDPKLNSTTWDIVGLVESRMELFKRVLDSQNDMAKKIREVNPELIEKLLKNPKTVGVLSEYLS
ncbi:MAG: hypothetical protein LBT03_01910 [Holosporales bacterium]|jgi:hypothetical protein|nr:hypothetical protein [Holosporales bacterium]